MHAHINTLSDSLTTPTHPPPLPSHPLIRQQMLKTVLGALVSGANVKPHSKLAVS